MAAMASRAFDPERLRPLAKRYGRRFPAGRAVFREDEGGDDFYIILEGEVEITKSYPDTGGAGPRTEVLNVLGPGDFFGEMALLEGEKRFATATAKTSVECLVFGRAEFDGLVGENTRLAVQMMRSLSRRLREACRHPRAVPR
jgi:CRP-like cAMP-binding protein